MGICACMSTDWVVIFIIFLIRLSVYMCVLNSALDVCKCKVNREKETEKSKRKKNKVSLFLIIQSRSSPYGECHNVHFTLYTNSISYL